MNDEANEQLLDYLMEMGLLEPAKARTARVRARATELRGVKPGGLRDTGRFMVAPTALEQIGTLMQNAAGRQQEGEADQQEEAYMAARRSALERYRSAVTAARAAGQQPPPMPPELSQITGNETPGGGFLGLPFPSPAAGPQPGFAGPPGVPKIPGLPEDPYGLANT
jgi:hypothetical protein